MRSAVYLIDAVDPKALPRAGRLRERLRRHGLPAPPTGARCWSRGLPAPRAHTGLLAVPRNGGAVTELAASLDRNVMPGAPGYPGALPQ